MKSNDEAEHERNIENMIQYHDYKTPWKNKDAIVAKGLTTLNNPLDDTGYSYLDHYHTYSRDSDKNTETRKEPIKDTQTIKEPIEDTQTIKEPIKGPHFFNRVCYLMDGPTNTDPVLTGVGIIGQGGTWTIRGVSIYQIIVQGGGGGV